MKIHLKSKKDHCIPTEIRQSSGLPIRVHLSVTTLLNRVLLMQTHSCSAQTVAQTRMIHTE